MLKTAQTVLEKFQSTPSVRRETLPYCQDLRYTGISIHSLREEGDPISSFCKLKRYEISIHSLREEGDVLYDLRLFFLLLFQSTPSVRRETAETHLTHRQ